MRYHPVAHFFIDRILKSSSMNKAVYILAVLLVVGCSNTTPLVEPEDDESNPEQYNPGGLFTGDKGAFSFNDFFNPERRNGDRRRFITVTGSDVDVPAIDLDSFEEFERFKAWRRAQEEGSAEYKDWQEFQKFLKLKKENES